MSPNKAFRNYTTRISFSINLTRNQIYVLWEIANKRVSDRQRQQTFGLITDTFVPGAKWLCAHGFITHSNERVDQGLFPYQLTEAGEHVYALLVIAGLVSHDIDIENKAA